MTAKRREDTGKHQVYIEVPGTMYDRIVKRVKEEGFSTITEYIRDLLRKDLSEAKSQ